MPELYTIGHSTRLLSEFLALLAAHQITHLIDVRTIPKSRRVPWFNKEQLAASLREQKITYEHMPELGGLRHSKPDSINQGWRNLSFRGFADYMQTPGFASGLEKLNQRLQKKGRIAIMCAEALPWRCHRSLIADAEVIHGVNVWHIMSQTTLHVHEITPFAVVNKTKHPVQITYPRESA